MSTRDERVLHAVAHGTRSAAGRRQIRALADAVASRRPGLDVRLSYVDVQQPRDPTLADSILDRLVCPAISWQKAMRQTIRCKRT